MHDLLAIPRAVANVGKNGFHHRAMTFLRFFKGKAQDEKIPTVDLQILTPLRSPWKPYRKDGSPAGHPRFSYRLITLDKLRTFINKEFTNVMTPAFVDANKSPQRG